jgi:hypothetical protein
MAVADPQPQFLDWFEPDELEDCPACGKHHGLTIEAAGSFICFGCGYVRWSQGETTVSELQHKGRYSSD